MAEREGHESAPEDSLNPFLVSAVDPLRTGPFQSDDTRQEHISDLPTGTMLGDRYELTRELGRGGMGQVYRGRDTILDRTVAVKVIRPRDPKLRDRSLYETILRDAFVEEARIGAGLTHPAIATVHDFGFHGAEPFIVFEYIAGETLGEVIRHRHILPLEEVRLIIGPLAQALDFAHSQGVVHRDLKPENIRSTTQGHFKVLDLGLAKEFHNQVDWRFAGTPGYASPEQAGGLPCDGRTDQYALALIAYEMLTGHRVFEHSDWVEVLRMHCEQEPLPPQQFVPDLPESVCAALTRALQKDPNRRFGSCGEFALAIGCQLLSAPTALPEILRMAAVHMSGDWDSARFRLVRKGMTAYLILGQDALWGVYRGEIRSFPLQALTEITRNRWGSKLHLRFHRGAQVVRQSFVFAGRKDCGEWYQPLADVASRNTADAASSVSWQEVAPVVVMRRPPAMRYQGLGPVEFQDNRPRRLLPGLSVRAAMMGADAVVDVQDERLPQLGRTVHRRSGIAIKAVDTSGRSQLRARWFSGQVSQLSRWMLILIAVSFVATLLSNMVIALVGVTGIGAPLDPGESAAQRFTTVSIVVALIHGWPLVITVLTRWSLWPQFLRPAALAVLVLGMRPVGVLMGWLAAGVIGGRWASGWFTFLTLIDPVNAALVLFAFFLCRRAWRDYRDYRRLAPDAAKAVPTIRRTGGQLAMVTSCLYCLVLGGFQVWATYNFITSFSFPGNKSWQEREAITKFNEGVRLLKQDARLAEGVFRSVLPVWEELAGASRSRPEYRHNLASTHLNIGVSLALQGKTAGAIESLGRAIAEYERVGTENLGYHQHLGSYQSAVTLRDQLLVESSGKKAP